MFSNLKNFGVLGVNRRIGDFILPYNDRALYPMVDSKIKTANLAIENDIPIARHYMEISSYGGLKRLSEDLSAVFKKHNVNSFVVKPARGAMGNGVLVVEKATKDHSATGKEGWVFKTVRGNVLSLTRLKHYISDILGGLYSLNGFPDEVILQELLKIHPVFKKVCQSGIPDIRVIIFKGFPIMAMTRIPTRDSGGRANLHQGAIGCGLDIKTGTITHAIHGNQLVSDHPDTGHKLKGVEIPEWDKMLNMAAKCYEVVGLGYMGIDIVLDPIRGPLLLEMNARPGLSIQSANLSGLIPRLEKVEGLSDGLAAKERVSLAKSAFGI